MGKYRPCKSIAKQETGLRLSSSLHSPSDHLESLDLHLKCVSFLSSVSERKNGEEIDATGRSYSVRATHKVVIMSKENENVNIVSSLAACRNQAYTEVGNIYYYFQVGYVGCCNTASWVSCC